MPAPASDKLVEVVAALIREGGRFLICQRPAHKARPLDWEFPGGKVEAGETHQQALQRECEEELGIKLSVGSLYTQLDHRYPDLLIRLSLYEARITGGQPQLREHLALRWITVDQLREQAFCPADEAILKLLEERG